MDDENLYNLYLSDDSSDAVAIDEAPSSPQSEETIGIPELSSGVTASSEMEPIPSVPISPSFDTEKEQESCGHVADSVVSATGNNVGTSASSSRSSQVIVSSSQTDQHPGGNAAMKRSANELNDSLGEALLDNLPQRKRLRAGEQESSPRNLSDDHSMLPSPIGQHSNVAVSNEFDEELDDESPLSGNLGHAAAPGTVTSVPKATQPPTSDVEQDLSDDDTYMNNMNAESQQLLVVLILLAFMAWKRIGAGSGPPFGLDFGTRCVMCGRQLHPGPIGSTDQCRECRGQICSACAGRRHDCP